jgi:heptosyltransferase-2
VNELISFGPEDGVVSVSRKLSEKNFDLALVLPNSPRSALEVWLARIPQRIGHARPWRDWLLTQRVQERPGAAAMRKRSVSEINGLISGSTRRPAASIQYPASAHHLHQYLHLVGALGANPEPLAPRLVVADGEVAAVRKRFGLDELSAGGRPLFALNPGAEYGPAKRWPLERFIAAAREIQNRTNCRWLILGGKSEIAMAEQIHSAFRTPHSPLRTLAGQTSLRELMAVLKLCRVLLTNDTGPMHVAAALGTPVVVPFGSTSPELTGPGLPGDPRHRLLKSNAPCAPCFLRECPIDFRCMNGITVERVVGAVVEV